MSLNRLRTRVITPLFLAGLLGVFVAAAWAGKPGGGSPPPPPPGNIYFTGLVKSGGAVNEFSMRMRGDGSAKTRVSYGIPSNGLHGGDQSFLKTDVWYDAPYDEFGNPTTYVDLVANVLVNGQWQNIRLTSSRDIYWMSDDYAMAWSRDDSFISRPAIGVTADGQPYGGLFVIPIQWTNGIPVAGSPTLVLKTDFNWVPESPFVSSVNVGEHDWSPDGQSLVFTARDQAGYALYVADSAGAGIHRVTSGEFPQWSPDGRRIAFNTDTSNPEIWTINPDGSTAVRLTQATSTTKESRWQYFPTWSPDGAYLAYTQAVKSGNTTVRSVLRIPSAGGSAVNLTSDIAGGYWPRWRP